MVKDTVATKLETLRREQILEAATKVFAEKGFRAARMQEVAATAGVANGTVYNYFASKDELLLALLEELSEHEWCAEQITELRSGAVEAVFSQQLKQRFQRLLEQKELWRVVLPELIVNPELRQRGCERLIGSTTDLEEAVFKGLSAGNQASSSPPTATAMVRAVAGSVLGVFVLALLGDDKTEAEADAIIETLAKAFAATLRGGAAEAEV